ncbi:MAG: hypothetical protein KJ811_00875, partial [Candidatus Margulisbacteria bacterium]|nr:hypothetical protein [Candidatus Margulisiibacteriota bacterium]
MSGETLRFDRINRGPHRAGIPRDVFRRGGRDRFSIACGRAGSYLSTHSASITSLYARFSLGSRPSLEIFNRRLALGLTHLLLQNPSLTEDISLGTMRQSYFIGEARESAQEADRPALETTERFIANTQVTTRALDILSNTENLQSFITSLSLIIRQLSTETKAENQQAKSAGEQLTEFVNSINASIKQTAEKIEQNIRTKLKPGEKVEIKDHEEIITRLVEAGKLVKKIAEAIKSHEPLALAKELKAAESNLDPIAKEVIKAKIASEIAKDPKANLPKVIKAAATDKAIKSLLLKAIAENLKEAPARSTKTKTQEATSQPQLKPVPATTQGAKLKVGGKPAKAVGQKIFGQKI